MVISIKLLIVWLGFHQKVRFNPLINNVLIIQMVYQYYGSIEFGNIFNYLFNQIVMEIHIAIIKIS